MRLHWTGSTLHSTPDASFNFLAIRLIDTVAIFFGGGGGGGVKIIGSSSSVFIDI